MLTRISVLRSRLVTRNEKLPWALVVAGVDTVAKGARYGNGLLCRTTLRPALPAPLIRPVNSSGAP